MSGLKDQLLGDELYRPRFDGTTFNEQLDGQRLQTQFDRVFDLMKDGQWRTLKGIQKITGGSEASISARLRDFRKPRHGSHIVERRRAGDGLWEYRVEVRG